MGVLSKWIWKHQKILGWLPAYADKYVDSDDEERAWLSPGFHPNKIQHYTKEMFKEKQTVPTELVAIDWKLH